MRTRTRCLALLALACASPGAPSVERCPDLRMLPPRPSESCEADPAVVAYEDRIAALLTGGAGTLALRVMLDERARIATVCAEGTLRGMENARTRRILGADLPELLALAPGPPCLAGRRIDVDRRRAKRVEIERIETSCNEEVRQGYRPSKRSDPGSTGRVLVPNACIAAHLSWLFAELRGSWWQFSARPRAKSGWLLFAPIEGARPAPPRPDLVAEACAKLAEREALVACMREQRWELLD